VSEKVRDEKPAEPEDAGRADQPGGQDVAGGSASAAEPAEPAGPAESAEPAGPPSRLEAFVTGGAYGVLVVAGAVVGLLGAFYHAVDVGPIPLLAIAFALLNLGAFWLAGWAMGTRLGAAAPALAWLLVVIFASSKRPEGDLVISGSAAGYVYLLGGSIAAVLAVVRTRSTTPWI
jgi:uncharacterized protein DUF6113